jgi:predicted outer membrane protein
LLRELLDNYFGVHTKNLTIKELWEISEQLLKLEKLLKDLKIKINFPDILTLGIKVEKQDLQEFIYGNFLKCFWNEELGWEISKTINFDWYSKRYTEEEFKKMIKNNLKIIYLHKERACYSGRFKK